MKSSPKQQAGETLRRLIRENYSSQEEFAYERHIELRTVNRWINNGINKVDVIQELADIFGVQITDFFQ